MPPLPRTQTRHPMKNISSVTVVGRQLITATGALPTQGSWVRVGGAPTKVDRFGYRPAIPAWGLVRSAGGLSTTRPRRDTPFFTRLDATRNHASRSTPVATTSVSRRLALKLPRPSFYWANVAD